MPARVHPLRQDALMQLDKTERIEKLEATYQNVREGYLQTLARVQ